MTKLCNTCEYLKFCARSGIEDVGCDRYKKDMTTNEEWFCGLSTEEKADVLTEIACESYYAGLDGKLPPRHNCKHFMKWLKEKHDG